jgi:hypothetical protein
MVISKIGFDIVSSYLARLLFRHFRHNAINRWLVGDTGNEKEAAQVEPKKMPLIAHESIHCDLYLPNEPYLCDKYDV